MNPFSRLKQDPIFSSFIKGVGSVLPVRLLGAGLAFSSQVLLANWFGAETFGEYIYVYSWIIVLVLVAKAGTDVASLRFVASYNSLKEWALLKGYLSFATMLTALVGTVLSVAGLVLIWQYSALIASGLLFTAAVGLALLLPTAFNQLLVAQVQGLKRAGLAEYANSVLRAGLIIAGAFVINAGVAKPQASMIMAVDLMATLVALLFIWWVRRGLVKDLLANVKPVFLSKEWGGVALPMLLVAAAQITLAKTDILMVGSFLGSEATGKYAVATTVASLVTFFINICSAIIAPRIAEIYAKKDLRSLQRFVSISVLSISAVSFPVFLALYVFAGPVLGLFGPEFEDQAMTLRVLLIGHAIIVLWGSVGFLLTMTNHQNLALWTVGGTAIMNIALNAIMIPIYGIIGAALATAITVSLRSFILGFVAWRKLGIVPTVFAPLIKPRILMR